MKEDIRKIRMRQKWLELYAETGSVTKTALRCGIARSTLYRWINREKEQGKSELSDKSKRSSRLANMKITPEIETDRKSTRLNSSHIEESRMPSSA